MKKLKSYKGEIELSGEEILVGGWGFYTEISYLNATVEDDALFFLVSFNVLLNEH